MCLKQQDLNVLPNMEIGMFAATSRWFLPHEWYEYQKYEAYNNKASLFLVETEEEMLTLTWVQLMNRVEVHADVIRYAYIRKMWPS
jgi:hypothetical protein